MPPTSEPVSAATMVRFRNRYLLCSIEFQYDSARTAMALTPRTITNTVKHSLTVNFGDIGSGQAAPVLSVKYWSGPLALAVVRASRDFYTTVWAAITLTTAMPRDRLDNPVRITVVHVGATIRACQKAALRYSELVIAAERRRGLPVDHLEAEARATHRDLAEMENV